MTPPEPTPRPPRVHVARAELVLAHADAQPLRAVPLKPDPLAPFARTFDALRDDLGERASVVVDLMPVRPADRRRHRRRLLQAARTGPAPGPAAAPAGRSVLDEVMVGLGHPPRPGRGRGATPAGQSQGRPDTSVERRETRALTDRILQRDVLFGLQILVRVEAQVPGRPQAHLQALIACFETWGERNWLQVRGLNLGVAFIGADAPWRAGGSTAASTPAASARDGGRWSPPPRWPAG